MEVEKFDADLFKGFLELIPSEDGKKVFIVAHAPGRVDAVVVKFLKSLSEDFVRGVDRDDISEYLISATPDSMQGWPDRFSQLFRERGRGKVFRIPEGEWQGLDCGVVGSLEVLGQAVGALALLLTAFMSDRLGTDNWTTRFPPLASAFAMIVRWWPVPTRPAEPVDRGLTRLPIDRSAPAELTLHEMRPNNCHNFGDLLQSHWLYCGTRGTCVEMIPV